MLGERLTLTTVLGAVSLGERADVIAQLPAEYRDFAFAPSPVEADPPGEA